MKIDQITLLKLFHLAQQKETMIIDIREQFEHIREKIQGSINIPLSQILIDVPNISDIESKKIILYCKAGVRSIVAAGTLQEEEFKYNILNLQGGLIAWKRCNLSTIVYVI